MRKKIIIGAVGVGLIVGIALLVLGNREQGEGIRDQGEGIRDQDEDQVADILNDEINDTAFLDDAGENDPLRALLERQRSYTDTEVTGRATVSLSAIHEAPMSGANIWLHSVPDGQGRVIMSTERDQVIWMAELDVNNPGARPDWKQMVSKAELGGSGVADHWHVYTQGDHYLVFSQPSANSAYIMKVDSDLNRVALKQIVDQYPLTEDDGPQAQNSNQTQYLVTNDMFLIEEPDGVTAAFFLPGVGHKLFRMDTNLNVYEIKNIGGGDYQHGNGSSAIAVDGGFHLLASDTIVEVMQSGVRLIAFDSDWEPISEQVLVNFDHQSIGMVSGVYLDDGSLIMHARTSLDAVGRGEQAPSRSSNTDSDAGYIARYLFDADLELASVDYLYDDDKTASRPHTSLIDNLLLTAWDYQGNTTLRIDAIH
jgi:hypothetical protein